MYMFSNYHRNQSVFVERERPVYKPYMPCKNTVIATFWQNYKFIQFLSTFLSDLYSNRMLNCV